MSEDDLDAYEGVDLTVRDWCTVALTLHIHRSGLDPHLKEQQERIVNQIGAQTGVDRETLDTYRRELAADPDCPYEGEAWERNLDDLINDSSE